MLTAVQAIDERLIAPRYLIRTSARLTFYLLAQKMLQSLVVIHWSVTDTRQCEWYSICTYRVFAQFEQNNGNVIQCQRFWY